MTKTTGKERSRRIDRFYYEALDPFVRFKRFAGLCGFILGMVYAAWSFSTSNAVQMSSGDLSHAHFAWNETGCEQCHLPNVPIRPDALFGSSVENVKLNNDKCNSKCHSVTGHFDARTLSVVLQHESCSECHREHLGKDFSLVELSDKNCVRCHRQISSSLLVNIDKPVGNAFDFSAAGGHPDFRSLSKDPGTIKFSHVQHMRPGQPGKPGDLTIKRLNDIPPQYRSQYANRVDADGLIQLTCADCHAQDSPVKGFEYSKASSNEPRQATPSNEHYLYSPIDFDTHCIACHDLSGIPHGLNRALSKKALQSTLAKTQLEVTKEALRASSGQDAADNLVEPVSKTKESILRSLDEFQPRLEVLLSDDGWCIKCHQLAPKSSEKIVLDSNLPKRWFQGAVFPHGDHMMVDCKACHQQAFVQSDQAVDSQEEASIVIIAGIESCRECHISNPLDRAKVFAKSQPFVAQANCVDCHRYHVDPSPNTINKNQASHAFSSEDLQLVRQYVMRGAVK